MLEPKDYRFTISSGYSSASVYYKPKAKLFPTANTFAVLFQRPDIWENEEEMVDFWIKHYEIFIGMHERYYENMTKLNPQIILFGCRSIIAQSLYDSTNNIYKWTIKELRDWIKDNWDKWQTQFSTPDEAFEDCFLHASQEMTINFALGGSRTIPPYDPSNPNASRIPDGWEMDTGWFMNIKSPVYISFAKDYLAVKFADNEGDGYYLDATHPSPILGDMSSVREFSSKEEYINSLLDLVRNMRQKVKQAYPNKLVGINNFDYFDDSDPDKFFFEDEVDFIEREGSIRYSKATDLIEKEIKGIIRNSENGRIILMQHWRCFDDDNLGLSDKAELEARDNIAALAMYYLSMNKNVYFFSYQCILDYAIDMRTDGWFDAIAYDIGKPIGKYYLFANGQDPSNTSVEYKIFARNFTKGLVLLKPRPTWSSTNYGDESATTHNLDKTYRLLRADGTLSEPINAVTLRNWEGAILVEA